MFQQVGAETILGQIHPFGAASRALTFDYAFSV
jgi:hypothetical protein